MPGHHQNGNSRRLFVFQKPAANLIAVYIGQTVVEENEVGEYALGRLNPARPVKRRRDLQIRIRGRKNVLYKNEQHFRVVDHDYLLARFWLPFYRREFFERRDCNRRLRLSLSASLEENSFPGTFDRAFPGWRFIRFPYSHFAPAKHFLQRLDANLVARFGVRKLAVPHVDLTCLPSVCLCFDRGIAASSALQQDNVGQIERPQSSARIGRVGLLPGTEQCLHGGAEIGDFERFFDELQGPE